MPVKKSRGWCFTLNNPTEEEEKKILELTCKYVYQRERGEQGTEHLQGMLYWTNAVHFNAVKKILPRAHIEKMRNLKQSVLYCSKDESRIGTTMTNMDLSKYKKKAKMTFEEKRKIIDMMCEEPLSREEEEELKNILGVNLYNFNKWCAKNQ